MSEDPEPRTLLDYHAEVLDEPSQEDLPFSYNAYFASALTSLTEEEKEILRDIRDEVEAACNACDVNLYVPMEETDPDEHADIPAADVFHTDRKQVATADLLILVANHPSFGAGMEVEIARNALLPTVVILHEEGRLSRMVLGAPTFRRQIEYTSIDEIQPKLRKAIRKWISPVFDEVRKTKMFATRQAIGTNIRNERMRRGLSLKELADRIGIAREELERIEQEPVEVSNPSFMLLSRVAQVLEMAPAALLNPDLESGYAEVALQQHRDIGEALVGARETEEIPPADQRIIEERIESAVHRKTLEGDR